MRRHFISSFALLIAVELGLAAWGWADENGRPSTATRAPSSAVGVGDAATTDVPNNSAAAESKPASPPAEPNSRVPTLAKRKTDAAPAADPAPADAAAPGDAKPRASDPPAVSGEPLRPIPDPQEGAPVPVEAASFKGVTPGVATKADVQKAWGPPKATAVADGSPVKLYAVVPFRQVEVHYAANKVSAIVIRLERTFPAEAVAKTLDLMMVRPVAVSNNVGEVLGQAYPERGVMLAFEPSKGPGKASTNVAEIVIEPISAETFVLRAEAAMDSRYDLARHDLEQALSLEPGNARAHWLLGRVLAATEELSKAVAEAAEAARLEPKNAQYRVTLAQLLVRANRLSEALDEAHHALDLSEGRPHVRARATCLIGDLTASGAKPDFKKALSFHTQAIQLADPLRGDPHPAIRYAAKEVFVDAHLGAAHDIAWGAWKEKSKAVVRWLERAAAEANDMAAKEGSGPEPLFRVHTRALAAYVGLRGELDPEAEVKAVLDAGGQVIAAAHDPTRRTQAEWELGMALYDAVQIAQARTDHAGAAIWRVGRPVPGEGQRGEAVARDRLSLGPAVLPPRRGSRPARRRPQDRRCLVRQGPAVVGSPLAGRRGRRSRPPGRSLRQHGRLLLGNRPAAEGRRADATGHPLDRASREQNGFDRSALAVPYSNLAAMHRALGAPADAARDQEMASRAKDGKVK